MPRSPGSAGNIFQTAFLWKRLRPQPRDTIARAGRPNCLIHREFTSPFPAKSSSQRGHSNRNASRASFEGPLEPDTFSPLPKDPLIASFFVHIGLAEELGSPGTRELFKNSRLTGRDPELEEGLIFRAFVPTIPAIQAVSNSPDKQSAQKGRH